MFGNVTALEGLHVTWNSHMRVGEKERERECEKGGDSNPACEGWRERGDGGGRERERGRKGEPGGPEPPTLPGPHQLDTSPETGRQIVCFNRLDFHHTCTLSAS